MGRSLIKSIKQHTKAEHGQTLIETIVAMFILVSAIVSCLALAIYAINSSSSTKNETIATNLAREGIEVVRMMRDTNWLMAQDPTTSGQPSNNVDNITTCTYSGGVTHLCYPEAFDEPYDMNSDSTSASSTSIQNNYRLVLRTSGTYGYGSWELDVRGVVENYMLCLQADGTYQHNTTSNSINCDNGQFARKVWVGHPSSTTAPYTSNSNSPSAGNGHSPQKIIRSTVVWKGRGCTDFTTTVNPETLTTKCKIEVIETLTNWKDYQ